MKIRTLAVVLTALGLAIAARAEEFVIGVQIPLSGAQARAGSGMYEGIQTAADLFNKSGKKHSVRLIAIDDESNPAKAVAAVEKLASQGVVALVGGFGSNIIGPASDAANKLGLVYMTAGGVDNDLTRRGFKTFFRINNTQGYEKAVSTLLQEQGVKSVSIVHSTKEATSDLAKDLQQALAPKGVKVTLHAFDPSITDFKPIINKIKLQDKPEVIMMSGYENDYVGIIRAAKVLKPEVKAMIGVWSLATPKMWKDFPDLMPNVIGTSPLPFPVEFKQAEGKQFAETYKRLFDKDVDYLGQFGYVEASLLFEALARAADAGTLKKGGLPDELRKTNRETLIGRVQFDATGDNLNFRHRMGQHQGGKIVLVSPRDEATGPVVWPGVSW